MGIATKERKTGRRLFTANFPSTTPVPYLNRNLKVYCLIGIELNNGETNGILKVKKACLKIQAVNVNVCMQW